MGETPMKHSSKTFGAVSALLIASLLMHASAFADPESNARHQRIVGLWDVEVDIFNCATNAPMGSFVALHQYQLGGTGQVVPANSPTALSAHMMVWNHVKNDDYEMSAKMFRFDAGGNYIGWVVLSNEISISEDGSQYTGSGVADFYNTAGTYLFSSCPDLNGTRFEG